MRRRRITPGGTQRKIMLMYVNNVPFMGGSQINLANILEGLDKERFHPMVAVPADDSLGVECFSKAGTEVIPIPMKELNRLSPLVPVDVARSVWALTRLVRNRQVDLIHTNCQRGGVLASLTKLLTGVRVVWTVTDLGMPKVVKVFAGLPDMLMGVSRLALRQFGDDLPRRGVVFYYDLIPDMRLRGPERHKARQEIRRDLGIDQDGLVVGKVANFLPWKGHEVLLQAAAEVRRRGGKVFFLLVGGAPGKGRVHQAGVYRLVHQLQLGDVVRFVGFVEDPWNYYAAMDILVHSPTWTESFGRVVAEAMCHGLPVIASRLGGYLEFVREGETALLFDPGDWRGLAALVSKLAEDSCLRESLGERGRRQYEETFSVTKQLAALEEIYVKLVNEGPWP